MNIKEASLEKLNDFCGLVEPIIDFLKLNWEGKLQPKDYDNKKDDYDDYFGEKLEYNGLKNRTATSFSIDEKLSLHNTAYDDLEQGRDTLTTLVGSLVGFGLQVGEQRKTLNIKEKLERYGDLKELSNKLIENKISDDERVNLAFLLIELNSI